MRHSPSTWKDSPPKRAFDEEMFEGFNVVVKLKIQHDYVNSTVKGKGTLSVLRRSNQLQKIFLKILPIPNMLHFGLDRGKKNYIQILYTMPRDCYTLVYVYAMANIEIITQK